MVRSHVEWKVVPVVTLRPDTNVCFQHETPWRTFVDDRTLGKVEMEIFFFFLPLSLPYVWFMFHLNWNVLASVLFFSSVLLSQDAR